MLPTEPAWPERRRAPKRRRVGKPQREVGGQRQRLAILVIVPVLLMLGSVYMHTVSTGLEARIVGLQQQLDEAGAEGERLEVEVAKLSAADRVRPLAREKLGMRDAGSAELRVYRGEQREDGISDAGEERGGGRP
jgi:cell division protein FtsL